MDRTALDNVFDQVGFCGIWCGSCAVGSSALMALAEKYKALCESHGLGHWGAEEFDYAEFLNGLDSIARLAGCAGCLQGGGRSDCGLRACATTRDIAACSSCNQTAACTHASLLKHMRDGARAAGMMVADKASEHDIPEEQRRAELRSLWWWRALLGEDVQT